MYTCHDIITYCMDDIVSQMYSIISQKYNAKWLMVKSRNLNCTRCLKSSYFLLRKSNPVSQTSKSHIHTRT